MRPMWMLLISILLGLALASSATAGHAEIDSPLSPPATPLSPVTTPTLHADFNIITPTPDLRSVTMLTFEAHSP